MRGQMTSRGPDTWKLRAYVGYDADTGKRAFLYRTFHGGKRAAERELARLVREADALRGRGEAPGRTRPGPAPKGPVTVGGCLEAWWAWASPRMEPNGAVEARRQIDNRLVPHLGDVALWRLRGDLALEPGDAADPELVSLTAFYRQLETSGAKRPAGGPLSAASVKRTHVVLSSALAYGVVRNWLATNPASAAQLPYVGRRPATTPEARAALAFVAWLERQATGGTHVDHAAANLLVALHAMRSGGRRVDLALRWYDYNQATGELVLGARGLIAGKDASGATVTLVLDNETHKRRHRKVALGGAAAAALRAHRVRALERAVACGVALPDHAYILSPEPDGSVPYHPKWATQAYARARKRAIADGLVGLAGVRFYDYRHYMGSEMLAGGVPVAVVAERMGNSARTMDLHYRHAVPAADRAAADTMDAIEARATQPRRGRGR